jgi:hypothetical protein
MSVSESRDWDRPKLTLPKNRPEPAPARQIPAQWRQVALELIALFESGNRSIEGAYANVSTTDVMSLGYLQWNHNAESLYRALLAKPTTGFVEAAPIRIRSDIETLLQVGANTSLLDKGRRVLVARVNDFERIG